MEANSGSLAISELFGAAAFITTVVLGCIILIQPFSVDPRSFVGDIVWFIIAGSMLVAFLADGHLVLGECLGILGLYVAFAIFAILRPDRSKHSHTPALRLSLEEFRDEVNAPESGDIEPDDLLVQSDDAARNLLSESNHAALFSVSASEPTDGVDNDSRYLYDTSTRDDHSDDEVDPSLSPQELDDLGLPPTANAAPPSLDERMRPEAAVGPSIWRNFPPIHSWRGQRKAEKVLAVFSIPLLLPIGLTIPPRPESKNFDASEEQIESTTLSTPTLSHRSHVQRFKAMLERLKEWKPPTKHHISQDWLLAVQLILGPQLFSLVLVSQSTESTNIIFLLSGALISICVSAALIVHAFPSTSNAPPSSRGDLVISILAFTTSLVWIYLTATSAVTLLMTIALIYDIPTALLGATIFAIGQSSNDLVANTAVARRGMPVLAASATFGGPMMNMFMGIGGVGLLQVIKSGKRGVYTFNSSSSLFVSAANLLLGLAMTLGYAFWNSWQLGRGLGVALIGTWLVFTIINVALSMTT